MFIRIAIANKVPLFKYFLFQLGNLKPIKPTTQNYVDQEEKLKKT
jgi:hypothetical protein